MIRQVEHIEWTALNSTYRVVNSNIQDYFDQANTATDILREIKFNQKWDVITPGLNSEVSGIGHALGKIYSESGSFITFDPRSRLSYAE